MAAQKIDVVVSDLCMPGKNGAELMREVEKKHPDVVRIIVSGKMDIGETIEAINKGHIHHYVVKPFKDKDLKLTLYQALLERERAEAEQRRQYERQQNIKRRARELGQLVVRTKNEVQGAYGEAIDALEGLAPEKSADVVNTAAFLAHAMGLADEKTRQVTVAARLRNVCGAADEGRVAARSAKSSAV
ncbi:MAG: response regulator [Gammaproteobacteria bacterium]|nr:response regulator [Gammaproteobacteria bacterium]